MKYNFQRGKGSPWWAWWKSDESFTQAFHFSIRLWETFIETTQLSPLAIHRQALHKPLTPQLGEGPLGGEEREGKAAAWSHPKTPSFFDGDRKKGREYPKEGRDSQFLLYYQCTNHRAIEKPPTVEKRNGESVRPRVKRQGPDLGFYYPCGFGTEFNTRPRSRPRTVTTAFPTF